MSRPDYLRAPSNTWHDTSSDTDTGAEEWASHPRILVLGENRASYTFPSTEAPVGEPLDTNTGHLWQPIIEQGEESYTDYLGGTQTIRTHSLKLAKLAKSDASRIDTLDLSPIPPQLAPTVERPGANYREAQLAQVAESWSLSATDNAVGFVTGLGVDGRRTSTDGLGLPGQLGWADLPDADGALFGVLSVNGFAIPRIRAANQLYGVPLGAGTRWQRNGWDEYPADLADYHPGHNGYDNPYPWGTGFAAPANHSQERYTVIGGFDAEHILVVVEQYQLTASVVSDFAAPHSHEIDYQAWNGLSGPTTSQTVVGKVLDKWRLSYLKPFTVSPGDESNFGGFGRDSDIASTCGRVVGDALHPFLPVVDPDDYAPPLPGIYLSEYESIDDAVAALAIFAAHVEEQANVGSYKGMRAHTVVVRLEVVEASTGTTVGSLTLRGTGTDEQLEVGDIIYGQSVVDQLITTDFSEWNLQQVDDGSLSRFWKPAAVEPPSGYVGGTENSLYESQGWGQWAHSVSGGEYGSSYLGSPATREGYVLLSRDASVCAGSTSPTTGDPLSPSGIYLFWAVDGVEPDPTAFDCVRHCLTTAYAPLALTPSNGKIRQALPTPHSTAHYCTDGTRVIFLPRPAKLPPRWISNSIPDGVGVPADPDVVTAWNAYLYSGGVAGQGPNNIACYLWDSEAETLALEWQHNTVTLTGGPAYYPSGAIHIACGDAPSNPLVTSNYLWVVMAGRWGTNMVTRRLCQISLTDGTLINSYAIEQLEDLQSTYLEVGDNMIVHDRLPTFVIRDASVNKILTITPS